MQRTERKDDHVRRGGYAAQARHGDHRNPKICAQQDNLAIIGATRTIEAIAAPIASDIKVQMIAQAPVGKWPQPPGRRLFKLAMPACKQGQLMRAVVKIHTPKMMSALSVPSTTKPR